MANELNNLAADIYKAADIVSREYVGFIPSVTINANGSERVAKGGLVRSSFTRSVEAQDLNQSMTIEEGTDQTIDNKTLAITKSRSVPIPFTGEDVKYLNSGIGFSTVYGDQLTQAMRTLTNEIEVDLKNEAYTSASRAVGTAGTAPFDDTLQPLGTLKQLFVDNGSPMNTGQRSFVMNSATEATLYGLTNLTDANRRGTPTFLEQGIIGRLNDFNMRVTGASMNVTKSAASGYLVNGIHAVGSTVINVDEGSGAFSAGDVITFAGDDNKYVVAGFVGLELTIAQPGLRQEAPNDAAITVGDNYTANVGFERSAIELAVRPPALPVINGSPRDGAKDRMTITDPVSGIPFDVALYFGQYKALIHISVAWGVKAWKSENINLLLG